jgi:predicted mannosyl-3-phosphoglycerate phosphatase (HAD superfamily)
MISNVLLEVIKQNPVNFFIILSSSKIIFEMVEQIDTVTVENKVFTD